MCHNISLGALVQHFKLNNGGVVPHYHGGDDSAESSKEGYRAVQ